MGLHKEQQQRPEENDKVNHRKTIMMANNQINY
jgi:hypothetical protein